MIRLLATLAALLAVAAAPAQAATLRPHAVITADHVTLGDLFDGLPPARAATPIARAPQPGRDVTLESAWVQRVARSYGVDYDPANPFERITLSRASHRIEPAAITEAVHQALGAQLGDRQVEIRFDNRSFDLNLPAETPATIAIEGLAYEPSSGRFTATLIAPADGPTAVRQPIAGRVITVSRVPVLTRRVPAGSAITAADLDWIEIPGDPPADAVTAPEELVGMALRRNVAPNAPVMRRDLQRPVVVSRNATVTMTLSSGPLTVTARGRALEDGGVGEVIRVLNVDSNRTVEATVTGPNAVAVPLGGPGAAPSAPVASVAPPAFVRTQ